MSFNCNSMSRTVAEDSASRRTHVMNDDILGLIFNELSVKQLIRLETVCIQFNDCIETALKKKTIGLSIGFNGYMNDTTDRKFVGEDISEAIVSKEDNKFDLIESQLTIDSILKKCSNIESIFLRNTSIDFKTLEVIVNRCPQLIQLYLVCVEIQWSEDKTDDEWTQLLSHMKHITVEGFYGNSLQLLSGLSSLESIDFVDFNDGTDRVMACLPPNINRLYISDRYLSAISLISLNTKCPQLESLALIHDNDNIIDAFDDWKRLFLTICESFQLKTLRVEFPQLSFQSYPLLYYTLSDQDFVKDIAKLTELQHLSISCNIVFNIQSMQTMPRLKSLSVRFVGIKMWTQMATKFPALKHMTIGHLLLPTSLAPIACQCHSVDTVCTVCPQLMFDFLKSVSQLPKLRSLYLDVNKFIAAKHLNLFTELRVLRVKRWTDMSALTDYCVHTIGHRVSPKAQTLVLFPHVRDALMERLSARNVAINPETIRFKTISPEPTIRSYEEWSLTPELLTAINSGLRCGLREAYSVDEVTQHLKSAIDYNPLEWCTVSWMCAPTVHHHYETMWSAQTGRVTVRADDLYFKIEWYSKDT